MPSIAEQIQAEVAEAPGEVQREVLDFAKFVRQRRAREAGERTAADEAERAHQLALAASAWVADWSTADEDAAWASL